MFVVRCKSCGKELNSKDGRSQCCGCSNMTSIVGDKITAVDLSQTVIVRMRVDDRDPKSYFSEADFEWRKKRSKRKVRKLDFEER